jgi:hypothetical protein
LPRRGARGGLSGIIKEYFDFETQIYCILYWIKNTTPNPSSLRRGVLAPKNQNFRSM